MGENRKSGKAKEVDLSKVMPEEIEPIRFFSAIPCIPRCADFCFLRREC